MPWTMCLTSASGCATEALELPASDLRLAQSVFDFTEVDLCFTVRGFAEGDDADFMIVLRMCDRDWNAGKNAKSDESLLAIREPVVFERLGQPLKDVRCVDEVELVLFEVDGSLAL